MGDSDSANMESMMGYIHKTLHITGFLLAQE
jgi:hypothetical protein